MNLSFIASEAEIVLLFIFDRLLNDLMEKQGMIIGIGFQKTGTSTLRDALSILGYRVKDTSSSMLMPIIKGNYNRILKYLDPYDAVEDTPWFMIYKELDQRIPGCRFILTLRDEESWYLSVARHIGDLRNPKHEWIYGRGKGLPKEDKEHTIRVFSQHVKEVREYFRDRPHDLLEIDFSKGDNWNKLCGFLDKPIPDVEFPHANRSTGSSDMRPFKKFRKSIHYGLWIKYLDLRGLW